MIADTAALRAIGWPFSGAPDDSVTGRAWTACMEAHPGARPARVIEQHRSGYAVAEGPEQTTRVESPPDWQRPRCSPGQRAAVGDWALVDGGVIVALLPRYTAIKRSAAGEHYRQQLIAANVDTVLVVCGLDADFNLRRIERYLLMLRADGVRTVVVLTKADKTDDVAANVAQLSELIAQGVPVLAVNAKDRASVASLDPWLGSGVTAVLVGSSGAGKSTLTNTLLGIEKMKTGEVRASDARGRHTTTHRALIPLLTGACLIDTPGMRELKPTGEEDLVEGGFADVEVIAEACRFRDCAHQREPGCAVRAALEAGTLDAARYANYRKLSDEVGIAADKLAQRRAQDAAARPPGKSLSRRLDEKHGRH